MGGFIQGPATIGGTVLAPGIPLAASPLSGLYQLTNGVGIAISQAQYFALTGQVYSVGKYSLTPGVISTVSGSPFATGALPTRLAKSPNGRFLYVCNAISNTVTGYERNLTTGALTQLSGSPYATALNPRGATVSPDGKFLYVSNIDSNSLSVFSIDPTTGILSVAGVSPIAVGANPQALKISSDGIHLYVGIAGAISAYTRNVTTGGLALVDSYGASGFVETISIAPGGAYLYSVGSAAPGFLNAYSRNTATGVLTALATYAVSNTPGYVDVSPDGLSVAVGCYGAFAIHIFTRSLSTGLLTVAAGSPYVRATGVYGVEWSPDSLYLYAAETTPQMSVWLRNVTDNTISQLATSPFALPVALPREITLSPDGLHIYIACGNGGVCAFQTATITNYPLINCAFDAIGGMGGVVNINGSLTIQGLPVMTTPLLAGSGGKYLKSTGSGLSWEGVTQSLAVAMVANAGAFTVDDSGSYVVDVNGVLGAAGALTGILTFPTLPLHVTFHNNTTGGFPLVLNATWTIPQGVSDWFWNGATFHIEGVEPFRTANVTPLPAAGAAVAVNHLSGVVPVHTVLELVCLTAEFGYAIGDTVQCNMEINVVMQGFTPWANATQVGFTLAVGYVLAITDKANGATVTPTAANWAYRFMVQT